MYVYNYFAFYSRNVQSIYNLFKYISYTALFEIAIFRVYIF